MIENDDKEKMQKVLSFLGLNMRYVSTSLSPYYELVHNDGNPFFYMTINECHMYTTNWNYEPSVATLLSVLKNAYKLYVRPTLKDNDSIQFDFVINPLHGCRNLDEMLLVVDMSDPLAKDVNET